MCSRAASSATSAAKSSWPRRIYKQHFSLLTGRCLEEPELSVPVYPVRVSEAGAVWVQCQPAALRAAATRRRLVVIGNGMAAMRTVEELLELAPHAYDITVFGAEPHGNYNRILLSPVLAGDKRAEEIVTHPPEWFARSRHHAASWRSGGAHRSWHRRVHSRLGVEAPYDRLLIATGSAPIVLPVPGP